MVYDPGVQEQNNTGSNSALADIEIKNQYAVQALLKFGNEGSSTTSSSFVTIQDSDITLDFDDIKDSNGKVFIQVVYHLRSGKSDDGESADARIYRQNAGTEVIGTQVSTPTDDDTYQILKTGWIELSDESGVESYQVQLRQGAGNLAEYNSVTLMVATPQA